MERRTGSLRFWAVTFILIMVTAFCCAGTVMSRTDFSREELECYYQERERQLVKDAREYLRQQGYENSGVMMTRVVEADGSREYTISIHHGRIMELDETERQQLAEGLRDIAYLDEACTFSMNFF